MATINSRCRNIGLRPLSTALIESSLQSRWQLPEDQAELLAHLADGRLGWAVNAAKDKNIITERSTHLESLYDAIDHNRVKRFDIADKLSRKAEDLPYVLETWLSWWRDLNILVQDQNGKQPTALPSVISNIDHREKLETYAQSWTPEQALDSLKQTSLALWQLQRNANTRLALENLLLTYPLPQ
jgi:DNA polymerase-3 subunit delta'